MKSLTDYIALNRKLQNPSVEYLNDFGELKTNTRALYYSVETTKKTYRVFAFISLPKTKKPRSGYPAVIVLHGGNGAAYYEFTEKWAERGFVAIALDLSNKCATSILARNLINATNCPTDYGSTEDLFTADPWQYFYTLAAMNAVDVLLGTNKVNPKKIYACGLSWGGFLNLSFVSVDQRISGASIIYSSAFIYETEWGNDPVRLGKFSKKQQEEYIGNIDPSNYLMNIKIPVLFTAGMDDLAFNCVQRKRTSSLISGPVYFAYRQNFKHGNFYGFEQEETYAFFHYLAKGKKIPQPQVAYKNQVSIRPFYQDSQLELVYAPKPVSSTKKTPFRKIKIVDRHGLTLPKNCGAYFVVEKYDSLSWSSDLIFNYEA
ncbi:MAG: alpha/beta hydrolase family protein [Bacilli bacterium]|jgi:dienelactone hydrolase